MFYIGMFLHTDYAIKLKIKSCLGIIAHRILIKYSYFADSFFILLMYIMKIEKNIFQEPKID